MVMRTSFILMVVPTLIMRQTQTIVEVVCLVVDACSPVVFHSATQKFVTLSVTEAETAAGVTCTQDMMYVYPILKSLP